MSFVMVLMSDDEVARYGRTAESGFGALSCARGVLPLTAMDVDARVEGVIASIEVAQTFVNTTGVAIEATYIFPLPDRAAVHRFRMEVAGRVIEGVVDERGAAREQYDRAIAAGHRAAITEEERSGVFTLRVGNLMPGEAATIRLSLTGPLPVDDGEVTFQFPLVVAPRYIPGQAILGEQAGLGRALDTNLVPDASRISPPVLLPGFPNPVRLGIRVALTDPAIGGVVSSMHAVTSSRRDAHVVEIQPGERLDRDFILRWRIDAPQLRSTLTCADDADGKGGTFMLSLVPPSTTALAAKPRDVVFVIDRSGSMDGWKMVAARRAAARMIDTLTSRDRFCTIAFDDRVELVPTSGLVDATDRNRFRSVEALAKIDSRGGTEMMDPLARAVAMLAGGHDDRERVVVLVTDGQVGNEDFIVREIGANLRNVKMFALGIDQAVNAGFLRKLASAGGGLCELVESEDRLDAVMAKVHRRIGMPVATNLGVRPTAFDVDASTIAPGKLPDVYAGAPVTILGRYRGRAPANAAIEVDGTTMGDPLHMRVARDESAGAAGLAPSWARAHIRDLEDRYAAGAHDLESRIVAVSKQFGVLSRFTAYVAIDRSAVVNPGGHLQQVVQAVESPAGWDKQTRSGGGGARMAMKAMLAGAPQMQMQPSLGRMAPAGDEFGSEESTATAGAPPADMVQAARRGGAPRPTESAPMPMPMPMAPGVAAYDADDELGAPARPKLRPAPSPMKAPPVPRGGMAKREVASPVTAYLASLGNLARELEAHAHGAADPTAIRIVRQRLVEWTEDLTSVGGHAELVAAVDALVKRLSAALAGATLATEALAIGAELLRLANGEPPPATPTKSRQFWK